MWEVEKFQDFCPRDMESCHLIFILCYVYFRDCAIIIRRGGQ